MKKWKIGVPSQQWVKIRTELWFTGVDLKGNVSSYTNQIKVTSFYPFCSKQWIRVMLEQEKESMGIIEYLFLKLH